MKKSTIIYFLSIFIILYFSCHSNIPEENSISSKQSSLLPKKLLIYYGWPSVINGSSNNDEAVTHFSNYDYVVLGAGLEQSGHGDHANVISIMNDTALEHVFFFGYVDLGVSTNNYDLTGDSTSIQGRVDLWISSGADGIFFDDFGYDYGTTRERQNWAVDYVHSNGLNVCANAWISADVFGDEVNISYNPSGIEGKLTSGDYYLCESYQISLSTYRTESDWQNRMTDVMAYKNSIGFKILSVTTHTDADTSYDENQFYYSWYSALLYGFEGAGWGERWFAAGDSNAPYRERPNINPGTKFKSDVTSGSNIFTRDTNKGIISINTSTHEYSFAGN